MFIIDMSGVGIKGLKLHIKDFKSLGDMRNKSNVNSTVTASSKPVYG